MKYIVNSKYIDKIICHSANEIEYYNDIFHPTQCGKFQYVKLGYEDIGTNYKNMKKEYIVAVGRSNRDYEFLIKALRNTSYELYIICDNMKECTKQNNIHVLRNCYGDEMINFMTQSFCVVPLKDANMSDGQLVILQVLSLGKPIVVTSSKGIEDYIENGKNGLVIEKTPQDLYDALNQLKDEKIYNGISLNARKSFEKEFSKKQEFKNLGEIVRKYVRN